MGIDTNLTTDLQINMDDLTKNTEGKKKEMEVAAIIIRRLNAVAPQCMQNISANLDYKEYIEKRDNRDLYEIEINVEDGEYNSFADVITELRCLLLNFYKYFGARHNTTFQALDVEELLDKSIFCLDENLKSTIDVQLALDLFKSEKTYDYKYLYPKGRYDSKLLKSVAHCRPERLKEYHNAISDKIALNEKGTVLLEELKKRKNEIDFDGVSQYVNSMWELPEIGNFISILAESYDIGEVNQGEIEGMFLIPKESTLMSKIMTILLGQIQRKRCIDEIKMSYKDWSQKLSKKISDWFEVYHEMKRGKARVFKALGIQQDFWTIVGDKNPLIDNEYFELPYLVKVWLMKGLCDHVLFKYKCIKDAIKKYKEEKCTVWKNDDGTEEYFYFSIMSNLRLYYHQISSDKSDHGLDIEQCESKDLEDALPNLKGVCKTFQSRSRLRPNGYNFKIIANNVQEVRSLIEKLVVENKPESLIESLEEYLMWVEIHEYNYLSINNESKISLFRDWKLKHPLKKPNAVQKTKLASSKKKLSKKRSMDNKEVNEYCENKKPKMINCLENVTLNSHSDLVSSKESTSENTKPATFVKNKFIDYKKSDDTALIATNKTTNYVISEDDDDTVVIGDGDEETVIKIISVRSLAPTALNILSTASNRNTREATCISVNSFY